MNQHQNVLITGSGSGFGLLTAQTLLANGYTVLATMRDSTSRNQPVADDLQAVATEQPGTLHILEMDVTSTGSVEAGVQAALERVAHVDVVVNNAGVGDGFAAFTEAVTMEQFQHIFDVNVFGVQRVTRALLPALRAQGHGLIVNISSTMGRIVLPFAAPYTATKYALEALSESYRYELAGTGVDVAVVEPGGFGTPFWTKLDGAGDSARMESYGSLVDLPRQMYGGMGDTLSAPGAPDPQAVADAVLHLVETPAGQRPLRTVVDPLMGGEGPTAINSTTDQVQQQLLTALGMERLLTLAAN